MSDCQQYRILFNKILTYNSYWFIIIIQMIDIVNFGSTYIVTTKTYIIIITELISLGVYVDRFKLTFGLGQPFDGKPKNGTILTHTHHPFNYHQHKY